MVRVLKHLVATLAEDLSTLHLNHNSMESASIHPSFFFFLLAFFDNISRHRLNGWNQCPGVTKHMHAAVKVLARASEVQFPNNLGSIAMEASQRSRWKAQSHSGSFKTSRASHIGAEGFWQTKIAKSIG